MSVLLLSLALLQAPAAPPATQAPAAPAPAPAAPPRKFRFRVEPDTIQHLGEVGPRDLRTLTYDVVNQSDRPIAFTLGDLAVGTTVDAASLATPLAPGDRRRISMTINPEGWVGYQRRAARLEPDDPKEPRFVLKADMTVRPDLTVDGTRRELGAVAAHESVETVFAFKRETGDPLELKLLSTPSPYLDADLTTKGGIGELRLTLRPTLLKGGQAAGLEILKVATNAPLQKEFTLYLNWRLKRPVELEPARLAFDSLTERHASLTLRSEKPFRIESIDFDRTAYELAGQTHGEALEHRITLYRKGTPKAESPLTLRLSGVADPLVVPILFKDPRVKGPQGKVDLKPETDAEHAGHRH
ncbi:MAG TPA: hypothetical protein VJ623_08280 [Holophagaceae bacterium]|nr:hypothetical protein [Holophagaceae bacterium]